MILPGVFLVAALGVAQGHTIPFPGKTQSVEYALTASVSASYLGGKSAPPQTVARFAGKIEIRLTTENGGSMLVMRAREFKPLGDSTKFSETELRLLSRGSWQCGLTRRDHALTIDGKKATPSVLGSPLWPFVWEPITSESPLKLGQVIPRVYSIPAQAFLMDDPVGEVRLAADARLDEVLPNEYRFVATGQEATTRPVSHPEAQGLTLSSTLRVDGRWTVSRTDGWIDSGSILLIATLELSSPEHPFGFSKAKATVACDLRRLR
ncbi:MAG: hypothetical protein AKCLJLPJ_00541 [Fimbriimonadales bacterium]|nr:hypothetical protein [Fimbriimonadales bacterium]